MKQSYLLFLFLFAGQAVFAQTNTVVLDVRVLPIFEGILAGGTAGYFKSVSDNRSLGLKATWNTDAIGAEDWEIRTHVINLDAVNRWNLSKDAKVNFFVEAGISGLYRIERTPPFSVYFCGVGMTDEEIEKQAERYSKWQNETEFALGFATATSLEFILSRQFSLGVALTANVYYSPSEDAICPYLVPSLRTAFSF